MASEVAKQVTLHDVYVGLWFLPSRGSASDMRGNGDSDCVLGRLGLQQGVLLARQLRVLHRTHKAILRGLARQATDVLTVRRVRAGIFAVEKQ